MICFAVVNWAIRFGTFYRDLDLLKNLALYHVDVGHLFFIDLLRVGENLENWIHLPSLFVTQFGNLRLNELAPVARYILSPC